MRVIRFILLIAICTVVPFGVSAQSKPKRDISKDKSVILAKKKKVAKKKAPMMAVKKEGLAKKKKVAMKAPVMAVNKGREKSLKNRPSQIVRTQKLASYLRVNQLPYVRKNVSPYGGKDMFEVNTDGKEWTVCALPTWCHLTKHSKSFTILYDNNPSHDERFDSFTVKADNFDIKIDVVQSGLPLNISATYNYGSIRHNFYGINSKGFRDNCMEISTNVTIKGAKDQKCLIVAFFYDDNNNSIKAAHNFSDYAIPSSKEVYTATEVIPTSDDAQTFNVLLYLPNNAMYLHKKRNTIKCELVVYCEKTSSYVSDARFTMYFMAKRKKDTVETMRL